MSLRREARAVAGFAFGLPALFPAEAHRGGALVVPFAPDGAALLAESAPAAR